MMDKSARRLVVGFSEVDKENVPLVGGKTANLGELVKAKFPVPNGFALTVEAYDLFLEENNLNSFIQGILSSVDVNDPSQLESASKKIQSRINSGKIPKEVSRDTIRFYKKLSGLFKHALVAVRSSATAEDAPGTSFAGQQSTFLNIKGEANVMNAVRECWASLFTPRSIFYRVQNKISHEKVKISVIVQKMVQSEVSGVGFSINPVTNDKSQIVIEAVWGLGEMIVQGSVVPDRYVVQKDTLAILSKEVATQDVELTKIGGETKENKVPEKRRELRKLDDREITFLAKMAELLQKHYYYPQDFEWAKEGNKIYLVQTRPITTIEAIKKEISGSSSVKISSTPILKGSPASPGYGTGRVRIIKSPKYIERVKKGDVLVAPMTSPDFVPAMKKASAIVTDAGGQTSHAAIVSRELGIPCVVGTKEATTKLKEDLVVTVDGTNGFVYLGSKVTKEESTNKVVLKKDLKTATRVYVNLGEPELAKKVAKENVDGVGLLRAEFMIANIGMHPKEAIKRKKQKVFVDKLAESIETFCKEFEPRPVVYRATDFKTNEYRALPGGEAWEPKEPNPLLGFRGAFRYVANPEVFTLEIQAINKVREKYKNLWVMIPYVRSPEELASVKRLLAAENLLRSPSFKLWMMVELPVNVILLEDFLEVGIDGVSIGSNDLTMLISGTDRDNETVAASFDERSPAVIWALERVIKSCIRHNVSSSICGQSVSTYDDLVEKIVSLGITSVSVNPDAIDRVRNVIYEAEKKLARRIK